ncbi:MAG: M20/M25/M40 family metallo-hydrolase [bacterium]|nr:M20/M25/M40 family metallo-hydrolase [bacterium]
MSSQDDAEGVSASHHETQKRIIAAGLEDGFAAEWLETLCDSIGPRLTGSPQMDSAIEFAVKTMRDEGFDKVWTEPVMVPHWVRGNEWAKLTSPVEEKLNISGLGGSVGTPRKGIEAEVLVVSGQEELDSRAAEVKGKIVVFNPEWEGYGPVVKYRGGGASMAARHGAVAALVRSATNVSLNTPHTGVMSYEEGVPKIPTASLTVEDAARMERLTDRGVPVRVRLMMEAENLGARRQFNVIGEIRGRELPDEIIVVGGHLDSWDVGTGAHDDGGGCALTLAAARLLHTLDLHPRRTIRVVLFVAEEQGGFGGRAYLEAHADELDRHVAALESDSGVFAPDGFSVRANEAVVERIATLAAPLKAIGADNVRKGWAGVDIGPIVDQGVPGIGHRCKNDKYFDYHHSPADTFEKVDPADLAGNVSAVAALIWAIAEDGLPRDGAE